MEARHFQIINFLVYKENEMAAESAEKIQDRSFDFNSLVYSYTRDKTRTKLTQERIYLFSLSLDLTFLTGTISFMIQSMYFCVGKGQAQRCPRLV